MRSRSRVRVAVLALLAAAAAPLWARAYAEEKVVNIVFTGKTDPQAVDPGGTGVLVLTGAIRKTSHVYANPAQFKVTPTPAPGVTYGKVETSPTKDWRDPEFPDEPAEKVWMDEVVVRVAFTLAPDAPSPANVGAEVGWSACDEGQCYGAEKQSVVVEVRRPGDAAGTTPEPATPLGHVENGSPPNVPGMMPAPGPSPDGPRDAVPAIASNVVRIESESATATVTFHDDHAEVEFAPNEGFYLNTGHQPGTIGPSVSGTPGSGITWMPAFLPLAEEKITEPYRATIGFKRETPGAPVRLSLVWQACLESGNCRAPESHSVVYDAQGARVERSAAPAATTGPAGDTGLLFPVVGESSGEAKVEAEESWISALWKQIGILFLGPIFLAGLLLAFTPCVLPIIPITVSIIGGGRTDLPRSRLTWLLTCYALGLSTAYGVLGLLAGTTGASLTAAFQSPVALYVIAGVFFVLSLGMFGIYELQPPAWLQRVQGGAKGGSVVGSFLFGAMAAVIASPCTGPAIVAMVLFTAQSGNVLLGFLMFFTLGLGMSSVFFAAGSFNLLMRPGPWMVWVRWSFGILLVAAAFYYLASAEKLVPPMLHVAGAVAAAAIGFFTWRHLAKREMDEKAAPKSVVLALILVLAVFVVGFLTKPGSLAWTDIRDRAHLVAAVEQAKKAGQVTVVDVWAPWCTYCRKYDHVIEGDPGLTAAFQKMNRLRINVDTDDRLDLRGGLGIPPNLQPYILFIDEQGRIQRSHDVPTWYKGKAASELEKRVKALGVPTTK